MACEAEQAAVDAAQTSRDLAADLVDAATAVLLAAEIVLANALLDLINCLLFPEGSTGRSSGSTPLDVLQEVEDLDEKQRATFDEEWAKATKGNRRMAKKFCVDTCYRKLVKMSDKSRGAFDEAYDNAMAD